MARHHVNTLEDERPWQVGGFADDLAVHQVSQTDKTGRGARGDGDVVEHRPHIELRPAHIEHQRNHQAQRAAMAGQTFVAGELPAAIGQEMDGKKHLHDVLSAAQEVVGLIKQTVTQAGSHKDTHETVDEQWVEDVLHFLFPVLHHRPLVNLLFLKQLPDNEICQRQSDKPAQRIPAERPEREARIPIDE